MLISVKTYAIDGLPKIEDIEEAYKIVSENNCIVELMWDVEYSGRYTRYIHPETITNLSAQEYFDNIVPHVYGV